MNPGVTLPTTDITVVHRSDGSGTTYIWVDYLAKVSPEWKQKVGVANSVNWPVGLGGKGNEGVRVLCKSDARLHWIRRADLRQTEQASATGRCRTLQANSSRATEQSVTAAAAEAAAKMPADFRVSITNAPGKDAYPISSFTWMLFYENPQDKKLAKTMVDFMKWALTDGQKLRATWDTRLCRRASSTSR